MNISKQNKKGFTIVEVVLVLAIAGLIFMMVFVAVPAVYRTQRDGQRKADLSRLTNSLSSYQSNNRGSLPSSSALPSESNSWTSFIKRYVRVAGDSFVDPSGTDYELKNTSGNGIPDTITDFNHDKPYIYVTVGATCNGEKLTMDQGSRKVAFQMKLEGNGTACSSN